jgi:exopolysaccharide production protein ExoZ
VVISVQYLRAVAAMMVVALHACDNLARMENANPAISFHVGLAGVDIFFVISGFIIFVTAEQSAVGSLGFLRKRIIRVAPLYWILTLCLASAALIKPDLLTTTVFEGRHFVASLLFFPWQHPNVDALLPTLIPGWTLNYEMAFYVLFALSLTLPKPIRLLALMALLVGLAAVGLVIPEGGAAGFYTDPIILEFAAGVLIAKMWTSGVSVHRNAAVATTLAGFLLMYLANDTELPRIVGAGIPACMIVAGAVFSERQGAMRPVGLLVTLGNASYSMYLSHVLAIPVLSKLWRIAGLDGGGWFGPTFVALAMIVSALVGVVVYEIVERPMLRWLSGKRPVALWRIPGLKGASLPGD